MWIADSYAKINLGLNFLERLPAGKYSVETGLAFIDWRDRFEVEPAEEMSININSENEDTSVEKPIKQAVKVLNRYVGLQQNYHFNVEKRIPEGSGLGGYSSNAAFTLRMLNKIENLDLSQSDLIDISRDIAPDVPFFIRGEAGISRGVSNEFESLDIQPDLWIVSCFPNESRDDFDPYQFIEPNPDPEPPLEKILNEEPVEEWRYILFNDLVKATFQRIHVSGNLKDQFYEFGAVYASMSGRGTAVYGLFEQNIVATHAYKTLIDLGYPVNLTRPGFEPDRGIYRK